MKFVILSIIFMIFAWGIDAGAVNCIEGKKMSDDCRGLHGAGFYGCCNQRINVWCERSPAKHEEALCYHDCALNTHPLMEQCGWNTHFGYYSCFNGGPDPSGEHPVACPECEPECRDKECGYDGCYGLCGRCDQGKYCDNGKCRPCNCTGRECGTDQCNSPCGTCADGKFCNKDGLCVDPSVVPYACFLHPEPGSETKKLDDCVCKGKGDRSCCQVKWNDKCIKDAMDCGLICPCKPDCEGKQCGDDGCGGTCGGCDTGLFCVEGQCEPCRDCTKQECGGNGCGVPCGTCTDNKACIRGKCLDPPAWCQEKSGPGCSNPAEDCDKDIVKCVCEAKNDHYCCNTKWDWLCVTEYLACANQVFEHPLVCPCVPTCKTRECGDDGCEGTCGQCSKGMECNRFGRCVKPGVKCGNNVCEAGEDCQCCPEDCGCVDNMVCNNGTCGDPPKIEPRPDSAKDAFEIIDYADAGHEDDRMDMPDCAKDVNVADQSAKDDVKKPVQDIKAGDIYPDNGPDTSHKPSSGCDTGKQGKNSWIYLFLLIIFVLGARKKAG